MSVRVEDRYKSGSGGKMRVLVACEKLAVYTANITDNPKKFNPIHTRIIGRIAGEASEIYHSARAANRVKVTNSETRTARRRAQVKALQTCEYLATDICIAKGLFHLSTKRVKHWDGLVQEAENMLRAWMNAEDLQYKQYPLNRE